MDLLLVFVVLASLGLAAFMSVVAWKLLRDNRERSAARVAALETLAGEEVADVARFHEEGDAPEPPLEEPGDELYPREVAYDGDDLDGDFGHAPDASDDSMDDEIDRAFRPAPAPALPDREKRRPARVHQHPAARSTRSLPIYGTARNRGQINEPLMAEELFAASVVPPRPPRQGLSVALVALVVLVVGTGVVYAVRHAPSFEELSRRTASVDPSTAPPLELLSLRHSSDPTGAFTVTGLVENPVKGSSFTNVVAVVYLFDEDGQYFAGGRARINASVFRPGDQSGFVVTIPGAGLVSRYRVGFRLEDGGVVAHVDERQRLRRTAPGEAVNGADRSPDRPAATPHRVEG